MHVLLTRSCLEQAAYHAYLIFIAGGDKNIRDLCNRQLPTLPNITKNLSSLVCYYSSSEKEQSSPADFSEFFL
jgi:hypothetical protein